MSTAAEKRIGLPMSSVSSRASSSLFSTRRSARRKSTLLRFFRRQVAPNARVKSTPSGRDGEINVSARAGRHRGQQRAVHRASAFECFSGHSLHIFSVDKRVAPDGEVLCQLAPILGVGFHRFGFLVYAVIDRWASIPGGDSKRSRRTTFRTFPEAFLGRSSPSSTVNASGIL